MSCTDVNLHTLDPADLVRTERDPDVLEDELTLIYRLNSFDTGERKLKRANFLECR